MGVISNNSNAKCAQDKVCKVPESDLKILSALYDNREGLRHKTLMKLTSLKTRVLYKRLNILKEKELIENQFPIWKICNGQVEKCALLLKDKNIFELHNLSYVLKLMKVPEWWNQRKRRLIKLKGWQFSNVNFGKGNSNPYQQLINENFVIQCYPESLIIIARKRYYSQNPHEVIISAMNDVLDLIAWFEERMKFKFFPDGVPCLELRNNDYNRMKDHLANTCKKEGKRFLVQTEKGKVWVDYSEPFGKEADTPDIQETLERVTKDHVINKPLLNSELQALIESLANSQLNQSEQIEKFAVALNRHIPAYEGMALQVKLLNKTIKELKSEIKALKSTNKQGETPS